MCWLLSLATAACAVTAFAGSEPAEAFTDAECREICNKVEASKNYTEEDIAKTCLGTATRTNRCPFFAEALSLASSHSDFEVERFCFDMGEARFCSATMDRLLVSSAVSDLAYGECIRAKAKGKNEEYCKKFQTMLTVGVQNEDLDTLRTCYIIQAYATEANSTSKDLELEPAPVVPPPERRIITSSSEELAPLGNGSAAQPLPMAPSPVPGRVRAPGIILQPKPFDGFGDGGGSMSVNRSQTIITVPIPAGIVAAGSSLEVPAAPLNGVTTQTMPAQYVASSVAQTSRNLTTAQGHARGARPGTAGIAPMSKPAQVANSSLAAGQATPAAARSILQPVASGLTQPLVVGAAAETVVSQEAQHVPPRLPFVAAATVAQKPAIAKQPELPTPPAAAQSPSMTVGSAVPSAVGVAASRTPGTGQQSSLASPLASAQPLASAGNLVHVAAPPAATAAQQRVDSSTQPAAVAVPAQEQYPAHMPAGTSMAAAAASARSGVHSVPHPAATAHATVAPTATQLPVAVTLPATAPGKTAASAKVATTGTEVRSALGQPDTVAQSAEVVASVAAPPPLTPHGVSDAAAPAAIVPPILQPTASAPAAAANQPQTSLAFANRGAQQGAAGAKVQLQAQMPARPLAQPQALPQAQPQALPQAQPQVQLHAQQQPQAQAQPLPQLQEQMQPELEVQQRAQLQAQAQAQAQPQPPFQVQGQLQAKPQTPPQAQSQVHPVAQVRAQPLGQPLAQPQTQLQARLHVQPQQEQPQQQQQQQQVAQAVVNVPSPRSQPEALSVQNITGMASPTHKEAATTQAPLSPWSFLPSLANALPRLTGLATISSHTSARQQHVPAAGRGQSQTGAKLGSGQQSSAAAAAAAAPPPPAVGNPAAGTKTSPAAVAAVAALRVNRSTSTRKVAGALFATSNASSAGRVAQPADAARGDAATSADARPISGNYSLSRKLPVVPAPAANSSLREGGRKRAGLTQSRQGGISQYNGFLSKFVQ